MNTEELSNLLAAEGELPYRGKQLAEWVYKRGARTIKEMNNIPDALRERLEQKYEVGRSQITAIQRGHDGTMKLLMEMHDGAKVETVGLPYADRFSCCISTQVGCPVACVFCATGLSGYVRDLTAGEIVDQVLSVQQAVRNQPPQNNQSCRIDHVTFMGMGEPLLNYIETVRALRLLNTELGIAMRNLTVSTAGFVPGIRRLMQEKLQITLAVSLHASDGALRKQLIPGMAKWSVAEIVNSCREYIYQTGRRVTFEYCLLGGINDSAAEAHELNILLRGLNCHVNLIPYNPVPGLNFHASSPKTVRAFREILVSAGIQVTQRVQRGSDIDAACGQLRQRTMETALNQSPFAR